MPHAVWRSLRELAVLTFGFAIITSLLFLPNLAKAQGYSYRQQVDQEITTEAQAQGINPACPIAIADRGPAPYQLSATGDIGPMDFHASEIDGRMGLWDHMREIGIAHGPVTQVSIDEQIYVAVKALALGYKSSWSPVPSACYVGVP